MAYWEILIDVVNEDELETFMTKDEAIEYAYMLTQYERDGSIDFDEFLKEVFNENYSIEDYINDYADFDPDGVIYSMEEFDEQLQYESPTEIAMKIHFGNFNPNHKYFKFDGYNNLESFDNPIYEMDVDGYIDYLIDNASDYKLDIIEQVKDNEEKLIEYCKVLVAKGY